MAFPQIGLRAVFELTGFNKSYTQYQTAMRDIDRITKQTAQSVTQSGQKMGADIVRNFTDFARKSSIVKDAFENLKPEAAIQEYQRIGQAFTDLGDKAQVNVGVFDHLVNSGLGFTEAMQVAGGQIRINVQEFDKLIERGLSADQAFQRLTSGAGNAAQAVTILGRSFTTTAVAVTAITAAFGASIKLVRDSIEAYTELAEATRQLRYQTGLMTADASGWVQVLQASGLSATSSGRAMTTFLSKVSDLRREQLAGVESSDDFSKALDFLGVSITDSTGKLRPTEQLLGDVNQAFQELGPGVRTAQVAMDLFGYSGRQLLPILTDQKQSLSDFMTTFDQFGTTLTALSQQQYEEFRQANIELQAAIRGVSVYIATNWIPVLTQIARIAANVISIYRQIVDATYNVDGAQRTLVGNLTALADGLEVLNRNIGRIINAYQTLVAVLNPIPNLTNRIVTSILGEAKATEDVAQAEEEAARSRATAAQAAAEAAEAEEELRRQREETLNQLDELKTEMAQKLDEINEDARQRWEDILVNRAREAADRSLQNVWRLADLRDALNEQLANIEADAAKRWDDIFVKRMRDAIERGIRLGWRFEDLLRGLQQSRLDTIRDYNQREAEQRQDLQRKLEEAEREAQDKREKLERDHQRRLADIRFDYLDTVQEAARKNDAVAVARAVRERDRAVRDEQRRYQDEQSDLADSLAKKRQDIERDRQEREADQRAELERALQRIQENYDRQVDDLNRQNERERLLRELNYRWEEEDFLAAKEAQLQDAQDAYDKQIKELQKSQERQNILRQRQYEREEIDFVRAWQRRIYEERRQYQIERDELAAHLSISGAMLEQAYAAWINTAVGAATQAARAIANAWLSGMNDVGIIGGRGIIGAPHGISMAEGGVIHASSPTTVVMGDAGPETGIFLPGRGGTMNVNHNFGQLGVNFGGLPGGVDTAQIQSVVYQTMIQLAKNVQVKKWR